MTEPNDGQQTYVRLYDHLSGLLHNPRDYHTVVGVGTKPISNWKFKNLIEKP